MTATHFEVDLQTVFDIGAPGVVGVQTETGLAAVAHHHRLVQRVEELLDSGRPIETHHLQHKHRPLYLVQLEYCQHAGTTTTAHTLITGPSWMSRFHQSDMKFENNRKTFIYCQQLRIIFIF